ncbi:hypothetical protein F2Q69_00002482 [Brassica cretica]|uniref:Uncharacterized protein n=1 Tax=Brassica cretica TaxID=69181 RepID=A0A8S9P5Z0_BRACR|nr:hypothetical protein F2Q69_00002482 [Brassica cretica]
MSFQKHRGLIIFVLKESAFVGRACVRAQRKRDLVEASAEEFCRLGLTQGGARSDYLLGKKGNRPHYDDNCFGKLGSVLDTGIGTRGMTSLFKFQAMEYLVRFVVGDWSRLAHGTWKFNIDRTEVKYNVLLKENETYDALVEKRTMRGEEFRLTEDRTDVVPLKPIPWRGFPAGGYLQVSEEKLMTICSREQTDEI